MLICLRTWGRCWCWMIGYRLENRLRYVPFQADSGALSLSVALRLAFVISTILLLERIGMKEPIKTFTMSYLRGERAIIPKIFPCPWWGLWRRWGGLLSGRRACKGASNSYSQAQKLKYGKRNTNQAVFPLLFLKRWRLIIVLVDVALKFLGLSFLIVDTEL